MAAASRGSVPSRRHGEQPNTPRPCSSARIQSLGLKRNHLLASSSTTETTSPPTWRGEKKRARCGRRPARSGSSDWANLGGDGPAILIAELALTNDVADYVRFRAVCRSWRRCTPDPRGADQGALDGRFLPRQWLMLDKASGGPCRRRFLNVSTGERIRTDIPEVADHKLLALTPEGLLLLLHVPTLVVRLLNPLTRQLTSLPPVTALLTPPQQRAWRTEGVLSRDAIWVCGAGLADDASTVAVCFSRPKITVVAKPGDEHWTVVDDRYIDSTLPFAGRFYCAVGSSVMVLSNNSASDQGPAAPWQLVTVVQRSKPLYFCRMSDGLHFVDNGGELMLVHRMLRESSDGTQGAKRKREYDVYRVDFDAGDLVPVKSLRGRAVFMGRRRAVSVLPAKAFPSVVADTLYLGSDCDEKTRLNCIGGYNVADGSSEPRHHHWSFVACFSRCIRGTGKHLA
ncbi:unnamed protein product [Urochloa decumbens]|uniref:KIB1-4 beta-propeller domain-containing protein n=1 Tax=Urochloa decumbens TaxID=240449 RepID=A0ABC9FWT1_9POAL